MKPCYVTVGGADCPVCGTSAICRVDAGEFFLYECPECGCWSSDAACRGISTSFEPQNYFANAEAEQQKWAALFENLTARCHAVSSVLDVGCGGGEFLSFVHARYPEAALVGAELDKGRAEQARRANPSARIVDGDALEVVRTIEGTYDLVTLWDVFEHVREPAELLDALAARLAPGGVIYIQTINERSLLPFLGRLAYRLSFGRLRYPARRTHDAHHLVFFGEKGLRLLAARSSLDLCSLTYDRLVFERMDGSLAVRRVADLLLRLETAFGGGLFVNVLLQKSSR